MKQSSSDKNLHVVVIDVDGAIDEVMAATAEQAEALGESVVQAAIDLATVRVPMLQFSSGKFTVVGTIVLDLAKARRTLVRVESHPRETTAMAIKR